MAKATEMRPTERKDPDYPPGVAYVEGRYCPISEAKISVLDWGFLRSDATYDVVHVWQRRFFRLDAHLDRFSRSVEKLRLTLPVDRGAAAGGIMPVGIIDGQAICDGKPGPFTTRLTALYWEKHFDPAWTTAVD